MSASEAADLAFLRGLTVLYLEDDADVRGQLTELLSRRVREVITASDGAEGLTALRARRPDIVITDIRMPGMDGLSLARMIRDEAPRLPIIVTTAFDQIEYLTRAIDVGVEQYVMKPIERRRMHATLLACARRLRLEAEAERRRALEAELRRAEALRLLAAGIAHDYNNLVQSILGNIDIAREMLPPSSPCLETLDEAVSAAREAGELGKRLLVLSERQPVRSKRCDVAEAVRRGLEEALGMSGVTVRVSIPLSCPDAALDPDALTAVVVQIATNAREAMNDHGTLSVTVEVVDVAAGALFPLPGGPHVHVAFADSGPGISASDLPRIFDPYFSTKPRGAERGVGLGLCVARGLVQRQRGTLTADSEPGRGATFHLWLPVAEPQ